MCSGVGTVPQHVTLHGVDMVLQKTAMLPVDRSSPALPVLRLRSADCAASTSPFILIRRIHSDFVLSTYTIDPKTRKASKTGGRVVPLYKFKRTSLQTNAGMLRALLLSITPPMASRLVQHGN